MNYTRPIRPFLMVLSLLLLYATPSRADDNWPQFRGRAGAGIGSGHPPTQWNLETGENILWKTPIEGLAHSSPIVWGDRVFVTTAVSAADTEPALGTGWLGGTGKSAEDAGSWSWQLHAYDLASGQLVWRQEVAAGQPLRRRHLKATHANCTPATDGQYIVAFFGAEGLYCYDVSGNLVWKTGFGRLHAGPHGYSDYEWGFASSPIIYDQYVVVQCDCLNASFAAVLRLADGIEVRRIPRSDVTTWSTPLVIQVEGQTQLVCNGYREMAAYDFDTGEKLWYLSGGGDIPVPTPLFAQGLVLLTNGHGRNPVYAISPAARGDITPWNDELAEDAAEAEESEQPADAAGKLPDGLIWYQPRNGSYIPTPIVVGDLLYTCNDNGRLTVTNVQDGSLVYQERVGGGATYSASVVGTDAHLYFADEAGSVRVVKTGPTFEITAENAMQETVMATPAIAGSRLLVRTVKQLVCIGQP
jgi:outer membrane protein assembly factor BamB